CIEDMKKFDTLLTYNGTNFDMPFLRTRALKHNIDFPKYMDLRHKDVYFMAKSRMRLHRKSMHVVSNALGIPGKTHVEGDYWIGATHQHRRDCLEMIFEHNKLDVIVLEKVYKKLKDYVMETRRSI
ncbi:MAG: ribonuclease H-like domain-containing protein, partial [Candidatus Thermoplasmatota archaeon]|nr:ribonuclease H-like domain-containing protein [Candidatus Thermoplasmatota archaeon]